MLQAAGSKRQGSAVDEEQPRPETAAGGIAVIRARGSHARRAVGRPSTGAGGAQAGAGRLPDPGRGDGQVQARVQDGKRETVAQGVVPGGSGVGADQVPVVVVGGRLKRWRWRHRRHVPEGRQRGGDGPEQEPQARRVGYTAVQAQAIGVRRPCGGGVGAGARGRARGQDAHQDGAPSVRQFGVCRVARVVGRRRGGRLQVVRRPARRQTEQVPGGRPEQQQDPAHTRGPADVVPVPRLGVVRRRPVPAVAAVRRRRRRKREVARLAAGRGRLAPRLEEHRILLAPDRARGGPLVRRGVAAAFQPVAQLRLGTVGTSGPDAAKETVAAVAAAATRRRQQEWRRRRGGGGQRRRGRRRRQRRRQTPSRARPPSR